MAYRKWEIVIQTITESRVPKRNYKENGYNIGNLMFDACMRESSYLEHSRDSLILLLVRHGNAAIIFN